MSSLARDKVSFTRGLPPGACAWNLLETDNNNNNINNNNAKNSFRMAPASSFIIHGNFQNLLDMQVLVVLKCLSGKPKKLQPRREDGDASLHEESGKHLSNLKK